jgi:hypothetical protein
MMRVDSRLLLAVSAAIALAAASPGTARAQSNSRVTKSTTIGLQYSRDDANSPLTSELVNNQPFARTLAFPRFDVASMGTLKSVTIDMRTTVSSFEHSYAYGWPDPPTVFDGGFQSLFNLFEPVTGLVWIDLAGYSASWAPDLGGSRGIDDSCYHANPECLSHDMVDSCYVCEDTATPRPATDRRTLTVTAPAALAAFQGSGTFDISFAGQIDHREGYEYDSVSGGYTEYQSQSNIDVELAVTVTYGYEGYTASGCAGPLAIAAGGPYQGQAGSPISFVAQATDWAFPIIAWQWDWECNGLWERGLGSRASHTYLVPYTGPVCVAAQDQCGTVAFASAPVSVPEPPPAGICTFIPGIVACYPFDGNTLDRSGNTNHGLPVGGDPVYVFGHDGAPGGALLFDGVGEYVRVLRETPFDLSALTVAAIVEVPDHSRPHWIATKGLNFGNFSYLIEGGASSISGWATYAHQTAAGNWSDVASAGPLPVGRYLHLVVTLDANGYAAYMDGALVAMAAAPPSPLFNDEPLLLGTDASLTNFFSGAVDDLRVYGRALSAQEVYALYRATYQREPTLLSLVPRSGPQAGGTSVTITGANFADGATVTFGGNTAMVVTASETSLTVVTPAGAAGSAQVVVTNPDGKQSAPVGLFEYLPPVSVRISKAGTGSGVVTSVPGGIDCGATCGGLFDAQSTVELVPTPELGSRFAGWGGACSGTGRCLVQMVLARGERQKAVTSTFIAMPPVTLSVAKDGTGEGVVQSIPQGVDCGATCTANFPYGSTVELDLVAAAHSLFTGWSGACSGTSPCTVVLTSAASVGATFQRVRHLLTVSRSGTGKGTVTATLGPLNCGTTCSALYDEATVVILTAQPDATSTFQGWAGPCTGVGTCQVTMDQESSVTASFAAAPVTYTITASATGNGTISPPGVTTLAAGRSQSYAITPGTGYRVNYVAVNGASVGALSSYTFSNVRQNYTIKADFVPITFAITVTQAPNASITPYTYGGFLAGTSQTYSITPNAGYHVADVLVDGASVGAVTSYTFGNISANHTISATISANPSYAITATAGANGSISPPGTSTLLGGQNQKYTIAPASTYRVERVFVDGVNVGAVTSYTFYSVSSNHTIDATFVKDEYTITSSVAGGSGAIQPLGAMTVPGGGGQTYAITAGDGYRINYVAVNGASVGAVASYTFSNVRQNYTIKADFVPITFAITVTQPVHGTITPYTFGGFLSGAGQTYSITPNAGYHVADVLVDGASVGAVTSYTFGSITANHTIAASMAANP